MGKIITIVALAIFFIILFISLGKNNQELPSTFINKEFPSLEVIDFETNKSYPIKNNFNGWTLVNFWASWCVTCRVEHPMLLKIRNEGDVHMLGINYKDEKIDAINFLTEFKSPFNNIVYDRDGRIGIDLGVYAMPESFLVDKDGFIRQKHLGELTAEIWQNKFLPIINQ